MLIDTMSACTMSPTFLAEQPLALSFWALPTAIAAFFVHGARLLLSDRRKLMTKTGAQAP